MSIELQSNNNNNNEIEVDEQEEEDEWESNEEVNTMNNHLDIDAQEQQQQQQQQRPPDPFTNASKFSHWTFSWAYPLLQVGLSQPLREQDLPSLPLEDTSMRNRMHVEKIWEEEKRQCHIRHRKRKRRYFDCFGCCCFGKRKDKSDRQQQKGTEQDDVFETSFRLGEEEEEEEEEDNDEINNVQRKTKQHHQQPKPNLHRAIFINYLQCTWFAQCMLLISMTCRIGQALALGLLVEQFTFANDDENKKGGNNVKKGYMYAGILVACGFVFVFCKQRQFFVTYRHGMQLRVGFVAAIYSKSLRLNSISSTATTSPNTTTDSIPSGRVMNIASNDVERFLHASNMVMFLFLSPLEAIAVLVVGMKVMGTSFAAGYGLLVLFVPLQFYLGKRFASLRSKVAAITDARVSLVSQAVSGVRVMKMNGWECEFNERIAKIRSHEMSKVLKASRYKAMNEAIYFFTNVAVSIVIFSVHVLSGQILTPRNVFTTMTLINILQHTVAKHFATAVMSASEVYVAISRIQEFLELPELSTATPWLAESNIKDEAAGYENGYREEAISMEGVTSYWGTNNASNISDKARMQSEMEDIKLSLSEQPPKRKSSLLGPVALSNITLSFQSGKLYCVIGQVGCGKSALLQALAGELPSVAGKINWYVSSLAYAAQDPWIMDGSVMENVLFGLPMDREWYDKVINACGLIEDLQQFTNGDATIVGDRGVQCSGGQRARIGLARALYRDADVLLLDDPLSAVDSKVGRLLYYSAITDLAVRRGRCVVLATHQHQFIGDTYCILMEKGRIKCCGSYSECVEASDGLLTSTLQTSEEESKVSQLQERKALSTSSADAKQDSELSEDKNDPKAENDHKESRVTGMVQLSTWIAYFNAMGGVWVFIALLTLYAITQASSLISIAQIGKWAEQEDQDSPAWMGLILALGAALILLSLTRGWMSFYFLIKASQRLHDGMTQSVLRSKIEFFDTNPVGRILNRFSADVGICDDLLPLTIYDFTVGAFIALGSIVMTIVVLPFMLLALPPLIWYFLRLRRIFVTTTRELKRLEGLGRSPIFAMLGEAQCGVASIRTNNATGFFKEKFEKIQNAHTRAFFSFVASSRWFAIRIDLIAFLLVTFSSFLAVLFQDQDWFGVDPAVLGLALTMLLQLAGTNFPWIVRQSAEVVNQMVSVERISGFGKLPPEADLTMKFDDSVKSFPTNPSIVVKNLTVRYRSSLPPALSDVSFKIDSGRRVGVVGRTGSGKSSLVQALLRILEAENGTIRVDDVDISKLGLHKVRGSMSVIPQTPVLFSGCTIRENLDPFCQYDESSIREALTDVQMMNEIDEIPEGLDSYICDGGSNFSVGQRQLICLARAILRKSKILILDEPTANVDTRTDELLQEAISKSFADATIISVAHRLESVIENDQILVLGGGKLLENASPKALLSIEGGHFVSMVDNTGRQMARSLNLRASKGQNKTD